jgi:hypothetical protein
VEGYESNVLSGSKLILANPDLKAIIIELNGSGERYGFKDNDIDQELRSLGFKPHLYDPFLRILTQKDSFGNKNTIYIRDSEFISARILSSRKYTVFGLEF